MFNPIAWYKEYQLKKDKKELVIETMLLPDFPSFKIDEADIWNRVIKDSRIEKIRKTKTNPVDLKFFTVRYSFKIKRDSECYPDYSPVKIVVTWSNQEVKNAKSKKD